MKKSFKKWLRKAKCLVILLKVYFSLKNLSFFQNRHNLATLEKTQPYINKSSIVSVATNVAE